MVAVCLVDADAESAARTRLCPLHGRAGPPGLLRFQRRQQFVCLSSRKLALVHHAFNLLVFFRHVFLPFPEVWFSRLSCTHACR